MTLQGANQRASVGLKYDTTAEELMTWLAGFPSEARISGGYTQGDRPWDASQYTLSASWDPQKHADAIAETYTNLDQAESIITRIDILKKIQNALKAAFAHRELDGGPKAAFDHDLFVKAQAEIDSLEEELTQLI